MTAIVREGAGGLSAIEAQAMALDVALRAAATLKSARGLLPEALKSEGEIVAVLLAGQELGLPPMASLRGLQVVRGKVIISYDTMVALLRRAGYRVAWTESTATRAELRLTAPDGSEHVETWDVERAKRAGLWGKGTWAQYPDTMLRARCVSSAARAFAGEVLAGVYVEEAGERAEIEARTVERPAVRERARDVVDVEPAAMDEVRAWAERGYEAEREQSRGVPTKLADLRDESEVRAWIAAHWLAARGQLGEDRAGQRVLAAAERLGLDGAEVAGWLAAATPREEVRDA
jgi:hypothetical protein